MTKKEKKEKKDKKTKKEKKPLIDQDDAHQSFHGYPPHQHPTEEDPKATTRASAGPGFFGPLSQKHVCPFCKSEMETEIEHQVGKKNYLWAGVVFLLGGCLGCFIIPLYMDSLKDKYHKCSTCHAILGKKNHDEKIVHI